ARAAWVPEASREPGGAGAASAGRSPVIRLRSAVARGAAGAAGPAPTPRTASPPPGAERRGAGGAITVAPAAGGGAVAGRRGSGGHARGRPPGPARRRARGARA